MRFVLLSAAMVLLTGASTPAKVEPQHDRHDATEDRAKASERDRSEDSCPVRVQPAQTDPGSTPLKRRYDPAEHEPMFLHAVDLRADGCSVLLLTDGRVVPPVRQDRRNTVRDVR